MIKINRKLCECGCEKPVPKIVNRFTNRSHANKRIPWNRGLTKNTDTRIADYAHSLKGKHKAPRRATRIYLRGYHRPEEVKEKISKKLKGKAKSESTKIKMSISRSGPNSSLYIDGRSKNGDSYGADWNKILKRKILERDNYECQLCNRKRQKGEKQLHVHHIDYDKKNCEPDNLVSLCKPCHMKTNTNREKWIEYFHVARLMKNECMNAEAMISHRPTGSFPEHHQD